MEFTNKLILGDNLEKLKEIESESIDLIYLDPPFFSNRDYEVIWGDEGEVRSFQDRWAGGMSHYIDWLKVRVEEMHRILKPTGSIFLHCDWHASAYIRVDILDRVFGENNFKNEIIWKRKTGRGETNHKSSRFGIDYDSVFFYSKTNTNIFVSQFSFDADGYNDYLESNFNLVDENNRKYRSADLGSPSPRANLTYTYKGFQPPKNGWAIEQSKMEEWDKEGRLLFPKTPNGRIRRKVFLDEVKGKPIQSIWDDIPMVTGSSKERIGYPTQKPEALLQRIIECASNEGDIVLDPFVGGGTTVAVAERLKRRWIGIDQSVMAIKVTDYRLKKQKNIFSQEYDLVLRHFDYKKLRNMDAYEFQKWIIEEFGGIPNVKKGPDDGIDGKTVDGVPIQAKRSDNVGVNTVKNFSVSAKQFNRTLFEKNQASQKPVGYIIAFSFSKNAIEEVARLKLKENIIIELKKVGDIVDMGKRPEVSLNANELDNSEFVFVADVKSEAGTEFFSWDFNHNEKDGFKPDIILDKDGKQKRKFKSGTHQIAVEAVDKSGLDGMDKIKIQVEE